MSGLSLRREQVHESGADSWFGLRTCTINLISCAKSETTSVHQALKNWFPIQHPMFTIVGVVEQGRVLILFLLQQIKQIRCSWTCDLTVF